MAGEEADGDFAADTRRPERVQLRPFEKETVHFPQISGRQRGNGSSERVPGDGKAVVGVVRKRLQGLFLDGVSDLGPTLPKALVDAAFVAEVRGGPLQLKILMPVCVRHGTSKAKHDKPVGVVNGQKSRIVG